MLMPPLVRFLSGIMGMRDPGDGGNRPGAWTNLDKRSDTWSLRLLRGFARLTTARRRSARLTPSVAAGSMPTSLPLALSVPQTDVTRFSARTTAPATARRTRTRETGFPSVPARRTAVTVSSALITSPATAGLTPSSVPLSEATGTGTTPTSASSLPSATEQRPECSVDGCTNRLRSDNSTGRCTGHLYVPVPVEWAECSLDGCGARV